MDVLNCRVRRCMVLRVTLPSPIQQRAEEIDVEFPVREFRRRPFPPADVLPIPVRPAPRVSIGLEARV